MLGTFRFVTVSLLTLLPLAAVPQAAQSADNNPETLRYQTANLLDVRKMVHRDPRMWQHDIPVTFTDVETYRMRLELDGKIYIIDYTPVVQPGYFPTAWVPGSQVKVRPDGRKMFLKTPGNDELTAQVVKRDK
jgi:hypothetical protein